MIRNNDMSGFMSVIGIYADTQREPVSTATARASQIQLDAALLKQHRVTLT